MPAPTSFPSYAYNATQLASIVVTTLAAFNALPLPGVWTTTPFVGTSGIPTDPGLTDTDIRLQQILIESRTTNYMLANGLNLVDEPAVYRADILANDSGLTS